MYNTAYQLNTSQGTSYSIGTNSLTIGRSRTNNIVLNDPRVSRLHARLLFAGGRYWIRDENSQAGTFVNGIRVTGQQALNPGDILQIGSVTFGLTPISQSPAVSRSFIPRKKRNQLTYVGIAGILLVVFIIVIAGSSGGSPTFPMPGLTVTTAPPPPGAVAIDSVSELIQAPVGGSVSLGNITLAIPPHALGADTTVTVSRPADIPDVGARGVGFIQLEPSGLSFSTPAELTLGYEEPVTFNEELLIFYTFNELEGRWEELTVISRDTANNRVVVEVSHFSFITTIFDRPIDLALHIPGEFLQKGDLIYALTISTEGSTEFKWFPGHAALYLGTTEADASPKDLDGETVIESTPLDGNLFCMGRGVRRSTLTDFVNPRYHIYMGARRLPGVSTEDRTNIASYALSALGRGAKYGLVSQGNMGSNCYSCVGLTEAAYDNAGHSIIPTLLEFPFIIPLEQYIRTEPVDEIVVQAGKLIDFDARRVIRNSTTGIFSDDNNVDITGCPSNATCNSGHVRWQTSDNDIGITVTLRFDASTTYANGAAYSAEQSLTIHVVGTGFGNITGQVVDATTGSALSGVTVTLDGTGETKTTDASGNYSFEGIPSGSYTVSADKSGYVKVSNPVIVNDNAATILNISLPHTANAGDIVITLSWGEHPLDLDSHLWLPDQNPYHIYFRDTGNLSAAPYVQLDVDDTQSYGPENITIRQKMDGRYTYAVYNYSGYPDIKTSSARVTVVIDGILVQTYVVPTSGTGLWWYVFDFDAITGNIISRNILTDQGPGQ